MFEKIKTFDIWFYKVLSQIDCIFNVFNSAFWRMNDKCDNVVISVKPLQYNKILFP